MATRPRGIVALDAEVGGLHHTGNLDLADYVAEGQLLKAMTKLETR